MPQWQESTERVTLSFQFCNNNNKGKGDQVWTATSSSSQSLFLFRAALGILFPNSWHIYRSDSVWSPTSIIPLYRVPISPTAPLASFHVHLSDNLVFNFDVVQMRNVKRPQFVRTRGWELARRKVLWDWAGSLFSVPLSKTTICTLYKSIS